MNVRDLIKELMQYPEDLEVIIQKDAEGNGYSPLSGANVGLYQAENTWSGSRVDEENDDDEDDSKTHGAIEALFLTPVN